MIQMRPGYFKIPPEEIGATLIFVPSFTPGVCVVDLARWGQTHGCAPVSYVPARSHGQAAQIRAEA